MRVVSTNLEAGYHDGPRDTGSDNPVKIVLDIHNDDGNVYEQSDIFDARRWKTFSRIASLFRPPGRTSGK